MWKPFQGNLVSCHKSDGVVSVMKVGDWGKYPTTTFDNLLHLRNNFKYIFF